MSKRVSHIVRASNKIGNLTITKYWCRKVDRTTGPPKNNHDKVCEVCKSKLAAMSDLRSQCYCYSETMGCRAESFGGMCVCEGKV